MKKNCSLVRKSKVLRIRSPKREGHPSKDNTITSIISSLSAEKCVSSDEA